MIKNVWKLGRIKSRCAFLLFFFITALTSNLNGQQLTVLDKTTSEKIYNVSVIPEGTGKVLFTNESGFVDVSEYKDVTNFVFRHPTYQRLILSFSELKELNFTVHLSERIVSINEVVVSANKWEQDKTEVANEIMSISPEQIANSNPQTAADVLKQTGQVFVQKSQLGGGSPMLRGFAANRVLIVVDGVRMNNAIFRSGNLQNVISIDPNIVESAEVVFGPGSVIYGSDALGGVMDFHTRMPVFTTKSKPVVKTNAFTRYSSANNENTGHLDLVISGRKLSLLSSFSYSDFEDLKTGTKRSSDYGDFGKRPVYAARINGQDVLVDNDDENVQRFSGYKQWSAIQRLRYRFDDNLEAVYGFYFANTSDIPRYDRLIQDNGHPDSLRNAEWYYGPQKWTMHHLTLSSFQETSLFDEARLTASVQDFLESRNDRRFGSNSLRVQTENVDVFTLNLDFDKSISNNNLFYGLEFTQNKVSSEAIRRDILTQQVSTIGSRYPNGGSEYKTLSAYTTYKLKLKERWVINTGLRYSSVWLDATTTDENAAIFNLDKIDLKNSAVNGSLGIVFKPAESVKWNLLFSSGFRSPNVDDVGKVFDLDDDIVLVPNANLKPEFSYNAELGLEKHVNGKLRFGLVTYYSILEDAIVRGPIQINGSSTINLDGEVKELRAQINANEAYVYGASGNIAYNISPYVSLTSTYTITRGRDKTNDEPLRHTTPNFGKTSIEFEKDKLRMEFFMEYNGKRLRDDIPISEIEDKDYLYASHRSDNSKDGSPAWHTFNIRGSYDFSEKLKLTTAIENIMDVHYRPYSSGISAPGRNFIISLRASF